VPTDPSRKPEPGEGPGPGKGSGPGGRPSKRDAARRRIADKRAAESAARAAEKRRRRNLVGGLSALAVLVLAMVITIVVQSNRTSVSATAAVPAHTSDGGTTIVVGRSTAPVTIDLYEDLQCPNCKALEAQDGATMAQLVSAGTVQLHYHPMAFLDSSANDKYSTRALNAAAAVLNAAGPDAFQKFHDLLYANQPPETGPGLTDAQLVGYAQQAGATGATVTRQIDELTYGGWVQKVTDHASQQGVTGTPTVLVDGKQLTDYSTTGLTAAVTAAQQN
jgi:protein-disulfide isomerase